MSAGIAVTAGAQTPAQAPASVKNETAAKPMLRRLEGLAGQRILVLPVQYLSATDSLGWSEQAGAVRSYLRTLDEEISFALEERGLRANWIFSDAVARSAKRNASFAADPYALQAGQLRMGVRSKAFQLAEPLASQLRSLIALNEARYILFPVEVRFSGGNGIGQGILHVVVVDARRSQIQWVGAVSGTPRASFSPALAADLASKLADMIAPAN